MNIKSLRVVAVFAAVCLSIGCTDRRVGEGEYLIEGRIKNIPDSTVIELLSEFFGKYILLDFWSVGCGPCMESIPEGNETARKHADRQAFPPRIRLTASRTSSSSLRKARSSTSGPATV